MDEPTPERTPTRKLRSQRTRVERAIIDEQMKERGDPKLSTGRMEVGEVIAKVQKVLRIPPIRSHNETRLKSSIRSLAQCHISNQSSSPKHSE
jgi:hypothetical protein